jgi:hypothetical protein
MARGLPRGDHHLGATIVIPVDGRAPVPDACRPRNH